MPADRDSPASSARIEVLPDAGIRVAGFERFRRQSGNAFEVGQRRHVHDRQAGLARSRDAAHQLPNAGRAVLGLLHAEHDQVELCPDRPHPACVAESVPGSFFDAISSSASRPLIGKRTTVPSRLIKLGGGLGADQRNAVPGHQQLGAEQRAVGGAENEYVVFHDSTLDRTLLARGLDFVVIQTEHGRGEFLRCAHRAAASAGRRQVNPTA